MKNKEVTSAFIAAITYLLLPDVGLTKPQSICLLVVLFGFAWAGLTWIECRREEKEAKIKKARKPRQEYIQYKLVGDHWRRVS